MNLTKRENTRTGETIYSAKHPSGLDIYIMPKKGYSQNFALFGTKYGSVDSEFRVPGEDRITKVPDGIAHYLEHKMFDMPDGSNVFDKFAKFGGNANAFTSFNMTAYLFSATENVYENLAVLMDYVQRPYFTEESVQKEQGIIGQEIRMYDDSASWKVFFNLLGCLYHKNPVKLEIAGTVESIAEINSDYLYKCYNTFYNLSNMMIFVTGDLDVEKTVSVIEANILKNEPFSEEIERIYPEEPKTIAKPYYEQVLSVAKPLFMIGFKDNDIGYSGEKLLKKIIEMEILITMLFSKSSEIYKTLYEEGLINQSFSAEYNPQKDYGFTSISGESESPDKVYEKILDMLSKTKISREDFQRCKKVVWGSYICSYDDIEGFAHEFMSMDFMDIDYFDYYSVYSSVTFEDVEKRFSQHFDKNLAAMSVVKPC